MFTFRKQVIGCFLSAFFCLFFFLPAAHAARANINGKTKVCAGSPEWYKVALDTNVAVIQYEWLVSGSGGASVFPIQPRGDSCKIVWGEAGLATLKVVVKDAYGFADTANLQVEVVNLPRPFIVNLNGVGCAPLVQSGEGRPKPPVAYTCYLVCDSNCFNYTTPFVPAATWHWSALGALSIDSSNGNTANICWGAATPAGNNAWLRVREVSDAGCVGEHEICIKIVQRPKAKFTSVPKAMNGVISVCSQSSVTFVDSSVADPASGLEYWFWDFGDGATATNKLSVSHIYAQSGQYTVTLTVRNRCGCTDTFKQLVVVHPLPSVVINCPTTVCAFEQATYWIEAACTAGVWAVTNGTITYNGGDSIKVQWGSGADGFGLVSFTPNCAGFCPYASQVVVPILPAIAQIEGSKKPCVGSVVAYSVPNIPGTSYYWKYKQQGAAPLAGFNVSDTLDHDNRFTIQWLNNGVAILEVRYVNEFLGCEGIARDTIRPAKSIQLQAAEKFCIGDTMQVSNTYQVPMYWRVYNEAGNLVSGLNLYPTPTFEFTFTQPGRFRVVGADAGSAYCNQPEIWVTVLEALPMLTDLLGENPVCPQTTATYAAQGQLPNTFVDWQVFGAIPNDFTATTTGSINVQWGITAIYEIWARQRMVEAPYCASPIAYFDVQKVQPSIPYIQGPDTVCANQKNVLYSTLAAAQEFVWSSPIGAVVSNSDAGAAYYTFYATPGPAKVRVSARVCGIWATVTKTVIVTPAPALDFSIAPAPFCTGKVIDFTANGSAADFIWDFGDGSVQSSANSPFIQHQYGKDSSYVVRLTATTPNGCLGTSVSVNNVQVLPSPSAQISYVGSLHRCLPDTVFNVNLYVSLDEGLLPNYVISWFKNGIQLPGAHSDQIVASQAGSYFATVTDTATGCATTTKVIMLVSDSCPPACPGSRINSIDIAVHCSTAIVSPRLCVDCAFYRWWIVTAPGGAGYYSYKPIDTIEYDKSGYYLAQLQGTFVNQYGDTCLFVVDSFVHIPIYPKMGVFVGCDSSGNNFGVRLNDFSNFTHAAITGNIWKKGTTTLCTNAAVCQPTLAPGTHTIALTISGGGQTCTDTQTLVVPNRPQANFAHLPAAAVCEKTPVLFYPIGINPNEVVWWEWTALDSLTKISNNDSTYFEFVFSGQNLGFRNVVLGIKDFYGCKNDTIISVEIKQNNLDIDIVDSFLTACSNSVIEISLRINNGTPTQFNWSRNGAYWGSGNPLLTNQSGTYNVQVFNDAGCTQRIYPYVQVKITTPFKPQLLGKQHYCAGYNGNVDIETMVPAGYSYRWLTSSPVVYNPAYPPIGYGNGNPLTMRWQHWQIAGYDTFRVRLAVTDTASGCSDTSLAFTIINHPYVPLPEIAPGYQGYCESDLPLTFTASLGSPYADPFYFTWSNGTAGNSVIADAPGAYVVTVTSIYGCNNTQRAVVSPSPNINEVISGCFKRCDSILVPGPKGNYTYLWFRNGNPFATTRDIRVKQSGTYWLVLTDNFTGCTDTTNRLYLQIDSCKIPCCPYWTWIHDLVTCLIDSTTGTPTGGVFMTVTLQYPGPMHKLRIRAEPIAFGSFTQLSFTNPYPGEYEVTGIYYPPVNRPDIKVMCLQWLIQDDLGNDSCHVEVCKLIPTCAANPCPILNANGFTTCEYLPDSSRRFTLIAQLEWGGASNTPFNVTMAGLQVQHFPSVFQAGNNMVFIEAIDAPPYELTSTLTISANHPSFGFCSTSFYFDELDCDTTPYTIDTTCVMNVTVSPDTCYGVDSAGNNIVGYTFYVQHSKPDSLIAFMLFENSNSFPSISPVWVAAGQVTAIHCKAVIDPANPINGGIYLIDNNTRTGCVYEFYFLDNPCDTTPCPQLKRDGFSYCFTNQDGAVVYNWAGAMQLSCCNNVPFEVLIPGVDTVLTFSAGFLNATLNTTAGIYAISGFDDLPLSGIVPDNFYIQIQHHNRSCTYPIAVQCVGDQTDTCKGVLPDSLSYQLSMGNCVGYTADGFPILTYTITVWNHTADTQLLIPVIVLIDNIYSFDSLTLDKFYAPPSGQPTLFSGIFVVADTSVAEICWRPAFIASSYPANVYCQDSMRCYPLQWNCDSAHNAARGAFMLVYPNPNSEYQSIANIAFDFGDEKPDRLVAADYTGKLMWQQQELPARGVVQVNTQWWSGGVYTIFSFKNRKVLATKRLVVVR